MAALIISFTHSYNMHPRIIPINNQEDSILISKLSIQCNGLYISRRAHEKFSKRVTRGMRHFNNLIRKVELIDLSLNNGLYLGQTTDGTHPDIIDRFLATKCFLEKFVGVQRLNRSISYHYPIVLSKGCYKWGLSPFRF